MKAIKIKRIYEDADSSDGYRILIDRLWPRGVSKEAAKLDEWNKELAPSTESESGSITPPSALKSSKSATAKN